VLTITGLDFALEFLKVALFQNHWKIKITYHHWPKIQVVSHSDRHRVLRFSLLVELQVQLFILVTKFDFSPLKKIVIHKSLINKFADHIDLL